MKPTLIRASKIASILLLATFANALMADTKTDYSSGWYVGGNIGMSTANVDEEKITQNLTTNYSYTDDERDLGYKLFGGYQFNKYFALEGGYFNLGKFDYSLSTGTGTAEGNIKIMGVNLDAVGTLPITEKFSVFGRVGAAYARAKDSFGTTGSISITDTNPKKSDLNYKFGGGLQYAITDAVGIRLEAERYRIDDAVGNRGDVDLFSVGLTYRFGVTKEVAPVPKQKEKVAPAPKEVAPAPKQKEILAPAPVAKICPVNVDTDKDGVFDPQDKCPNTPAGFKVDADGCPLKTTLYVNFVTDGDSIDAGGTEKVAEFAGFLKESPAYNATIVGHTDSTASDKYNQKLSERRANIVKAVLLDQGIAADRLKTRGEGEKMPVASNTTKQGRAENRRIEVELTH